MPEPATRSDGADIAVVIVNYNSGRDVATAVRSAYEAAGDARVQVVVADNHSEDGSAERVAEEFPQALVLRGERNLGFATAANHGMRQTSAPWVFLLNPDARVSAGTLGGLLKVAAARPGVGAVGVLTRNEDGSIYPSARKTPSYTEALMHAFGSPFAPNNRWTKAYRMAGWDRRTERSVDWVSGSSMLLCRAALDDVGLFDEHFFLYVEDLDLCTRLRDAGWDVRFSPELEVTHVGGTVTRGRRRTTLEHSRSMYRYFVKHRSPGLLAILRPFAWLALMARAELFSRMHGER
ncbi:MAG TPA: glycosyltransferase family 2 protein [Actinomycetota bacterium]|nr:glycosyltransferase family 2 protein [Actinomycetota bacterium]